MLEAGVGDRAELGPQRAVDADRGDGSEHGASRKPEPDVGRGGTYAQRRALVGSHCYMRTRTPM
jgi:hypothetical protein